MSAVLAESPMPVLEMNAISKTFNGLRVLKNVALKVYAGEVHALMGENGAGKSTLMKILSGAYQADAGGEIRVGGRTLAAFDPLTAKAQGIAVIYQELSLCPNLSVAENIYLGRELRRGWSIDRKAMEAGAPMYWRDWAPTSNLRPRSVCCRLPSDNWWRLPARFTPRRRFWSWTNRPRRCRPAKPIACLR